MFISILLNVSKNKFRSSLGSLTKHQGIWENNFDLVCPKCFIEERQVQPCILNYFKLNPVKFWLSFWCPSRKLLYNISEPPHEMPRRVYMKLSSTSSMSFTSKYLGREYITVSSFRAFRNSPLENLSTVLGSAHKVDWFNKALETVSATFMDEMCSGQGWLFEGNWVVTRPNLDVKDIQIASLFSLNCVSTLVESAKLQGELRANHVHSYLKVHPRSDINPEIICLNYWFSLKNVRSNLQKWGVIV